MKHIFEQKVFYADTDAYGVVWHGSYLRWLEMGRVYWCEANGHRLQELEAQNVVLPVTNLNIRYKRSARLDDQLSIHTWVSAFNGTSVTFTQEIYANGSNKPYIIADVEVVAITADEGKLYRKMPEVLATVFEKELLCQV